MSSPHPLSVAGATRAKVPGRNADRWGSSGSTAWVLDGATQPPGAACCEFDYVAFADAADRILRERANEFRGDLVALCRSVIRSLVEMHLDYHPDGVVPPGPSATMAVAHVDATQNVRWLVLGDAGCLIDGRLVVDTRLASVATAERSARRNASTKEQFADATRLLLAAEGNARNVDGGYWVVADDPAAATQALKGDGHLPFALATDGLHRHVGPGQLWERPMDLLEATLRYGPAAVVEIAHRREQSDSSMRPDDMSIVVAT